LTPIYIGSCTAEAEKRYARAWAWLSQVESADAALDGYDVPDKAREISRPPQQEIRKRI